MNPDSSSERVPQLDMMSLPVLSIDHYTYVHKTSNLSKHTTKCVLYSQALRCHHVCSEANEDTHLASLKSDSIQQGHSGREADCIFERCTQYSTVSCYSTKSVTAHLWWSPTTPNWNQLKESSTTAYTQQRPDLERNIQSPSSFWVLNNFITLLNHEK